MATYWVSTAGTDTEDGTTFAKAWKTLPYAISFFEGITPGGAKGDILNVVNDGTHYMCDNANYWMHNNYAGTNWDTDPGFTIRGTDSSGSPALATVAVTTDNADLVRMQVGAGAFVMQGLKFDISSLAGNPTDFADICTLGSGMAGQLGWRVQYCMFTAGSVESAIDTELHVVYPDGGNGTYACKRQEVKYCVFENIVRGIEMNMRGSGDDGSALIDHNVFIRTVPEVNNVYDYPEVWLVCGSGYTASNIEVTHNTFVVYLDNAATVLSGHTGVEVTFDDATCVNTFTFEDNFLWIGTDGDGSNLATLALKSPVGEEDASPAGGKVSNFAGGTNRLVTGPGITQASDIAAGGWYEAPVDPEDEVATAGNLYTNDVTASDTAAATICSQLTTATWTWESVNGTEYDLPLPGNWTATAYAGLASDGTTIGALFFAQTIPPTESDPIDPEYVDVAPFFAPDLDTYFRINFTTDVNGRRHHDFHFQPETEDWEESTHRRMVVATNTANQEITLGGVATAEYLMLATDEPITVSINGTSKHWPVNDVLAMSVASVTSLYVTNASTTNTATLNLVVVD